MVQIVVTMLTGWSGIGDAVQCVVVAMPSLSGALNVAFMPKPKWSKFSCLLDLHAWPIACLTTYQTKKASYG